MTTNFPKAIDALKNAAKGKKFNEAQADVEIGRCIEAYSSNYQADDNLTVDRKRLLAFFTEKNKNRKTITEGKKHFRKMRQTIATLQKDLKLLGGQDYQDTMFFAGGVYEEQKWWPDDHTAGYEALVMDIDALLDSLDKIDKRMMAVTETRAPRGQRRNKVEMITLDLADVYHRYTGRAPSSASQGVDGGREGSAFVIFVKAVLQKCDPKEAKRFALGQSISVWLSQERETISTLEQLNRNGG